MISEGYGQKRRVDVSLGRKDDSGKVKMELLMDMPRALKGVATVLTWAVTKKKPVPYEAGSWQQVEDFYKRYSGALLRHHNNIATNGQFALDHETQLLDLFHLATDALILAELTARELEKVTAVNISGNYVNREVVDAGTIRSDR